MFHKQRASASFIIAPCGESAALLDCDFCQFHIFAFASHKMFSAKGKASNTVKIVRKIAPHKCGLHQQHHEVMRLVCAY
jgi:hypothetical protein